MACQPAHGYSISLTRELHSLYIYIHIFVVLFKSFFVHYPVFLSNTQ